MTIAWKRSTLLASSLAVALAAVSAWGATATLTLLPLDAGGNPVASPPTLLRGTESFVQWNGTNQYVVVGVVLTALDPNGVPLHDFIPGPPPVPAVDFTGKDSVLSAQMFLNADGCWATSTPACGAVFPNSVVAELGSDGAVNIAGYAWGTPPLGPGKGAIAGYGPEYSVLATVELILPNSSDAICACGPLSIGFRSFGGSQNVLVTFGGTTIYPTLVGWTGVVYDPVAPDLTNVPTTVQASKNGNCEFEIPDLCLQYNQSTFVSDNCPMTCSQDKTGISSNASETVTLTFTESTTGLTFDKAIVVNASDLTAPTIVTGKTPSSPNLDANDACLADVPPLSDYLSELSATDNCTTDPTKIAWSAANPGGLTPPNASMKIAFDLSATDEAGNTATVTRTYNVKDRTNPVITGGPGTKTIYADGVSCTAALPDYRGSTELKVSDNCGVNTVTQTPLPGTVVGLSDTGHEVTLTVKDVGNNTATWKFKVKVKDNIKPVIVQGPPTTVEADCGTYVVPVLTGYLVVSDCNTGTMTRTQSVAVGTTWGVNTTNDVTFTVTDAGGNTTSKTYSITVKDTKPPTITSSGATLVVCMDPATCSYKVPTFDEAVAQGIISIPGFCPGYDVGSVSHTTISEGTTTVTYTVKDGADNSAWTNVPFDVRDCNSPALTYPSSTVVLTTTGSSVVVGTSASWLPKATDCNPNYAGGFPRVTVKDSDPEIVIDWAFYAFPLGTTHLQVKASDTRGNPVSIGYFDILVQQVDFINVVVEMGDLVTTGVSRNLQLEMQGTRSGATVVETRSTTATFSLNPYSFPGGATVTPTVPTAAFQLALPKDTVWSKMTAISPKYTLKRKVNLGGGSPTYTADFTGAKILLNGNANNDGFIDIVDFALVVGYLPPTLNIAGDLDGSGAVSFNPDALIPLRPANYLKQSESFASPAPAVVSNARSAAGGGGPRTKVSVSELKAMGISGAADANGDGFVDAKDVALLMKGQGKK